MNERDYLTVRRAYNVVRQHCESDRRLTFEEYAILCHLDMINGNVRVTEIASYQHALRPTLAHRMDHLEQRGLIMRGVVPDDRRATWVTLTADGVDVVKDLARQTLRSFPTDSSLRRVTIKRVERLVDAMGSIFLTAGDIIVLALMDEEEHRAQISALVDSTGFLQPTTSMAVSRLVKDGFAERCVVKGADGRRTTLARLTDEGVDRAHELIELIEAIVVRKERAELEALRAERAAAEAEAAREVVPEPEPVPAPKPAAVPARPQVSAAEREQIRRDAEARERGRRLMEPDDDLSMPLGQKIVLIVVAVIVIAVLLAMFVFPR